MTGSDDTFRRDLHPLGARLGDELVVYGALPGIALAIVLGRAFNRRLGGPSLIRYIHIDLVLVSVVLLWQSLA